LYICFSIGSGSGLDVFQIPQHRKALFVGRNFLILQMRYSFDFLDRIQATESDKLDITSIVSTSEYSTSKKIIENIESKEFKSSNLYKILFSIFTFGILGVTIQQHFFSHTSIEKIMSGYIIFGILIFVLIKQVYFEGYTIKTIRLDKKGIKIDDKLFQWDIIYETAILTEGSKYKSKYLVIAFKDLKTYEKYELNQFISFDIYGFSLTLSRYITYFQP
jgi:hypothetical protein